MSFSVLLKARPVSARFLGVNSSAESVEFEVELAIALIEIKESLHQL